MKRLFPKILMTCFFLMGLVLIGLKVEIKPQTTLSIVAGGSIIIAISKRKFGVRDGLDVADLATELGEYIQVNTRDIWSRIYSQLELEALMRKVGNVQGKFTSLSAKVTEVIQAWQPGWTPKGKSKFTPYVNEVFRAKMDYALDDIDEIFGGYLGFMSVEGRMRKDWPIVRYIVDELIIPKIVAELNIISAQGSYLAPTIGTPGNSINVANGIITITQNEITAGNLTEITTGTITAANAVDKFETYMDNIETLNPDMVKDGVILCSKTMERFYKKDYRDLFGGTNDQAAKNNTKLDNYNIEIRGLNCWGTSAGLLFTPLNNLVVGYDKIYTPNSFTVEEARRVVSIMTDFHRGYGFGTLETVFPSDQF